jgi:thiol-disulfide isomerase/thioredoxin
MPSRRWSTLLAIVLAIGCRRGPKVPDGDVLASLTAPIHFGSAAGGFDPAALKGKPTIVLFVTPTCSHCLATIPRAQKAAAAKDGNVVAVFVAGKPVNADGVVKHLDFTGPTLVDDGTLRKQYAVDAVPFILVLAADGHAVDAFEGEQDESTLADALASAR